MLEQVTDITRDELLGVVQNMKFEGYRFITLSCVTGPDESYELIYHFDLDMKLRNFRLVVEKGQSAPSISQIYFCAFLVENEVKELFGVAIDGVVLDYGGKLLLSDGAPSTPMAGGQITVVQK